MKSVIIIAIAFVLLIPIVAVALILDIDYAGHIETAIANLPEVQKITVPMFYDCAKTYDERMDLIHPYYESMQMDKVPDEIHYKAYDLSMEYLKNRCAITIESWAHESNHESKIWDSPWRAESYMSQLILGAVEPKNDSDRKIIEQYFENIKVEKQLREMKK